MTKRLGLRSYITLGQEALRGAHKKPGKQAIRAYRCQYCGGLDTSKARRDVHQAYHRNMDNWIRQGSEYLKLKDPKSTRFNNTGQSRLIKAKCNPRLGKMTDECEREADARGMCQKHYARAYQAAGKRKPRGRKISL